MQRSMPIDQLSIYVITGAGSASIRIGLYADNGQSAPGAALERSGQLSATAAGQKVLAVNRTLTPGLYWLATAPQGASITYTGTYNYAVSLPLTLPAVSGNWSGFSGYAYASYTANAALPDPAPAVNTVQTINTNGYLLPSTTAVGRPVVRIA